MLHFIVNSIWQTCVSDVSEVQHVIIDKAGYYCALLLGKEFQNTPLLTDVV